MEKASYFRMLTDNKIQPSVQRAAILEFLCSERIHPTADDIFERLHPGMPTLSRTTVYNTIRLFLEHGMVQPLVIEEKEVRYDIDTSYHGHFRCDVCGKVFDFTTAPAETCEIPELEGFQIRERHLYFKGICRTCSSE